MATSKLDTQGAREEQNVHDGGGQLPRGSVERTGVSIGGTDGGNVTRSAYLPGGIMHTYRPDVCGYCGTEHRLGVCQFCE